MSGSTGWSQSQHRQPSCSPISLKRAIRQAADDRSSGRTGSRNIAPVSPRQELPGVDQRSIDRWNSIRNTTGPTNSTRCTNPGGIVLDSDAGFDGHRWGYSHEGRARPGRPVTIHYTKEVTTMGYGIGGILVLILVILAIIYFAKRV